MHERRSGRLSSRYYTEYGKYGKNYPTDSDYVKFAKYNQFQKSPSVVVKHFQKPFKQTLDLFKLHTELQKHMSAGELDLAHISTKNHVSSSTTILSVQAQRPI